MNFIFDTETTGLYLQKGDKRGCPDPEDLDAYETCRMLSICWFVTQNEKIIEQTYYVIKPDGFVISPESIAIHGITHDHAIENGIDIKFVLAQMHLAISRCKNMVAHNIQFDVNVVKSEMHRHGFLDGIKEISQKHMICTMAKGKEYMRFYKNPKLSELYEFIYKEPLKDAHCAIADTHHCYKCFVKMFPSDSNLFFFKDKEVKLTDEQKEIVNTPFDKNILVIASAGSGKTSTTLARIKRLIDSGVNEESIMLTTFTRDAANDMKAKLFNIMGYRTNIRVGTIDSISKIYTVYQNPSNTSELKDVSEHGKDFLEQLRNNKDLVKKYSYLFVDEFQDINETQFNIIQEFYKNGCKLFCVGDDAQNLYTFRGSNLEYILNFKSHFPENTSVFKMTYNFRSTSDIINLANACIEKNIHQVPKKMVPGKDIPSQKPVVRYFTTQVQQSTHLLARVLELVNQYGTPYEEIAVISPVNNPLFHIEELFTQNKIPHVYLDGKNDVKNRVKQGHVCLCTIHKSKGLEWDHVFLINASDEIFPKMKNEKTIEDDRRVFYVAATRPRKTLSIFYSASPRAPYVTRFVSELDRKFYDFLDHKDVYTCGRSSSDFFYIDKSVTKLIDCLDGDDYARLKDLGIIPKIEQNDIIKHRLYPSFSYSGLVIKNDLYSDFGNLVDLYITRELVQRFSLEASRKERHALQMIANVTLTNADYEVYKEYRHNFRKNIKLLESFDDVKSNSNKIKTILEQGAKTISPFHMNVVSYVLTMIWERSRRYGVPVEKIPVFNHRFLPADFEEKMEPCHDAYSNKEHRSADIINEMWEVSKCKKIAIENRRRLLFSNITGKELYEDYKEMFGCISTRFIDFVASKKQTEVSCHDELCVEEGVYGESDLRIDDVLIDYKVTISNEMSLSWIAQLLCYKTMYDKNNVLIKKIGIFNPLQGIYYEIDVCKWDKHKELVTYLLQKREYLINKNSSSS